MDKVGDEDSCLTEGTICRRGAVKRRNVRPSKASLQRCLVYSVDHVSSICLLAGNKCAFGFTCSIAAMLQTSE